MRSKRLIAVALCFVSLTATAEKPYVSMEADLAALKTDFNDAVDQMRLVFIVGPKADGTAGRSR